MTSITLKITDEMVVALLKDCIRSQQKEIDRVERRVEKDGCGPYILEDRDDAQSVQEAAERLLQYYGVHGVDW